MNHKPHKNHTTAFTLLEILLVVAAIAILATIVIVAINPQRQLQQFRDTQRESHLNQLNSALNQYFIDNGSYPSGITESIKEICSTGTQQDVSEEECPDLANLSPLVPAYISQIPKDPTTQALIPKVHAQTTYPGTGYYVAIGEAQRIYLEAPSAETKTITAGFSTHTLIVEVETTANNQTVLLPLKTNVDVTIDWGDGTASQDFTTNDPTHVYATAGTYTIRARGKAEVFGNTVDGGIPNWNNRVRAVKSWGELGFTSFNSLFQVATNVELPNNFPTTVTTVRMMFRSSSFNRDINGWDVSNVTNMVEMFRGSSFNGDISNWDTGNVTIMVSMFLGTSFNRDISGWDVSNVSGMTWMFQDAIAFNQDISGWDTGNVTGMGNMFFGASAFNQPIGNWNTSKVLGMREMFSGATAFNQGISGWDYSALNNSNSLLDFLNGATSFSSENYGKLLEKWASYIGETPTIHTPLSPTISSKYPASAATHWNALDTYNWTITDLGQEI